MTPRPALTEEEISQAADNAVECHENIACENEAAFYRVGYIDGIVFALAVAAKVAEEREAKWREYEEYLRERDDIPGVYHACKELRAALGMEG